MIRTYEFPAPKTVKIEQFRWSVVITIVDVHGEEHEFVASADMQHTQGSSIYFATRTEYDEDSK